MSKIRGPRPVGEMTVDRDTLMCAGDPDLQLISWSAAPGSPSHDRLRELARSAVADR